MKKLVLIAGGALLVYVAIVLAIAVIPAVELSRVPPGPGVVDLTAEQAEGRRVFAANGCSYCHTQQVRPLAEDAEFGRPSAPGDFAYQTPELLGSARTGPDLSNEGARKGSDVWQYIHLYEPRAVVPDSIMPNFKFLFRVVDKASDDETPVAVPKAFAPEHGVVVPTPEAKALVAYLLSLKQTDIPGYGMGASSAAGPGHAAQPASAASDHGAGSGNGEKLFADNCAACHQASGEGVPGSFPPLKGNPAVLDDDPTLHLQTILDGAHGKTIDGEAYSAAMPPFADQLSDADIAAIATYERSSWGNDAATVTPQQVAAVRAGNAARAADAHGNSADKNADEAAKRDAEPAAGAAAGAAADTGYTFDAARGSKLFSATCAACHQDSGQGVPGAFPPLQDNPAVLDDDATQQLRTILFGLQGQAVDGKTYGSAMPPFGAQLSDEEIADIANHERSSWGNDAQRVTPSTVAKLRDKGQ